MNSTSNGQIDALVDTIGRLSAAQRRKLLRRLRVSGLLTGEELLTDKNRVAVAPALGLERHQSYPVAKTGRSPQAAPVHERTQVKEQRPLQPFKPAPAPPSTDDGYRSPVSGRIVVGSPEQNNILTDDPHAMHPLPGQAPEQPIGIVFDGGSRGNPGQGYGSYALRWPGMAQQVVRLQFGNHVTNNEAEYDTLIAAVEAVLKRLRDQDADPSTARLEIRGDSQLVVNQVNGEWQVRDERMKARCDRVQRLLRQFGRWRLAHHNRGRSVEVLGH